MKKRLLLLIALLSVTLNSCFLFEDKKEKFIETYREILIIRELYPDSAKAGKEIDKLYESNGYDRESFIDDYTDFKSNPEEFMAIMDSVRERNQRELNKPEKK